MRILQAPVITPLAFALALLLSVSGTAAVPLPAELSVSPGTRAIVVSPHPDDGVLGAGGLIERIIHRHGTVEVVEMTSGDAFSKGVAAVRLETPLTADSYRWYGTLRENEALRAMRQLGVPRSRVRLLGFPDEGLCELAHNPTLDAVFSSPYTQRDSPPAAEQLVAGAKYRGSDVRAELETVLLAFRPTLIVLPDSHDEHPDHCATHMLVHEAVDRARDAGLRPPSFLHYLIHYRNWPDDPDVRPSDSAWETLHLTDSERAGKIRAIDAYQSQVRVLAQFMGAFERPEERFVPGGENETLGPCWCRGENIALAAKTSR